MTVVVVNEQDHAMLLRTLEAMRALQPGTLQVDRDLSNRSVTLAEAEAVRAFNREAGRADRRGPGLAGRPFAGGPSDEREVQIPPVVAARMAAGVLLASGQVHEGAGLTGVVIEPVEVARLPGPLLAVILARRVLWWPIVRLRRVAARRGTKAGG